MIMSNCSIQTYEKNSIYLIYFVNFAQIYKKDNLKCFQQSERKQLTLEVAHADETTDKIMLNHTYNEAQIDWFKAGSALNLIKRQDN